MKSSRRCRAMMRLLLVTVCDAAAYGTEDQDQQPQLRRYQWATSSSIHRCRKLESAAGRGARGMPCAGG